MSYWIQAVGTKDEVLRTIDHQCETNSSPEMPLVKDALHAMLEGVEGDDKRVVVKATGSHSGGQVTHTWDIQTAIVVPVAVPVESDA